MQSTINAQLVDPSTLFAVGAGAAAVECPPEMSPDDHDRGLLLLEKLIRMRARLCWELDQQLRTLLSMPGVSEVAEDVQEAETADPSIQAAKPRIQRAPPKVSRHQVGPLSFVCTLGLHEPATFRPKSSKSLSSSAP